MNQTIISSFFDFIYLYSSINLLINQMISEAKVKQLVQQNSLKTE